MGFGRRSKIGAGVVLAGTVVIVVALILWSFRLQSPSGAPPWISPYGVAGGQSEVTVKQGDLVFMRYREQIFAERRGRWVEITEQERSAAARKAPKGPGLGRIYLMHGPKEVVVFSLRRVRDAVAAIPAGRLEEEYWWPIGDSGIDAVVEAVQTAPANVTTQLGKARSDSEHVLAKVFVRSYAGQAQVMVPVLFMRDEEDGLRAVAPDEELLSDIRDALKLPEGVESVPCSVFALNNTYLIPHDLSRVEPSRMVRTQTPVGQFEALEEAGGLIAPGIGPVERRDVWPSASTTGRALTCYLRVVADRVLIRRGDGHILSRSNAGKWEDVPLGE